MSDPGSDTADLLRPYLPRMLLQWLADSPGTILQEIEGTVVFVDISGFTKMKRRASRWRVPDKRVSCLNGSMTLAKSISENRPH